MKFTLPLAAAAAVVLAVPAFADEPREESTQQAAETAPTATETGSSESAVTQTEEEAPAPVDAPAPVQAPVVEEPEEEERICRRIRTDMASRRATRVCLTREEWREFNQRR